MAELAPPTLPVAVDLCYSGQAIRARNVPGSVDFRSRTAVGPLAVEPSGELLRAIEAVVAGNPAALTPLKIDPLDGAITTCRCGGNADPVLVDLGVGPHLGLVLERELAVLCRDCRSLAFPDEGDALRRRLADWTSQRPAPDRAEPSLLYVTDHHPRFVQIEVSTRCNLSCAYCSHKGLSRKSDLDWGGFLALLDEIDMPEVDALDFTGLGEATLNPWLEDMVAEARRRGPHLSLRLVSNALAAGPARWRRLVEAGLSSIAFSIDTVDPVRFERSRGGSLAKALRTAAAVGELRRECNDAFSLRLKAVLMDQPFSEAEALMQWSFAHNFDMPQFSTLDKRESATVIYAGQSWLVEAFPQPRRAEEFHRWSLDCWSALGGRAPAASIHQRRWRHAALAREAQTCRWGRDSTFIALGGDVQTCCESMIDLPRRFVGDVRTQRLSAAWQKDLFWNYRLPLSAGKPPASCIGCPQLVLDAGE